MPTTFPAAAQDRIDVRTFVDNAVALGADADAAHAAARVVATGQLVLLGVNGKYASGKDTVAPTVLQSLQVEDAVHLYYAAPLKDEADQIIAAITTSDDEAEATVRLGDELDIPAAHARHLIGLMWELTRDPDHGIHGRSRSLPVRHLLQYLGTDIRRASDTDYWVKRALVPAIDAIADGRCVYFTDVRFPNEVEAAQRIGFKVVRLEVTPETQRRRLLERDGIEPDPATLAHPSETSLDTYDGFDLVLDNNGQLEPTVERIAALYR